MAIGPIIAGLDIGHSKCCLACAEADPRGFLQLIGVAERSLLVDPPQSDASPGLLQRTITDLVRHFEQKYEVLIHTVQLAVNGKDVRGETIMDVDQTAIPSGHEIIHRLDGCGREVNWWNFPKGHVIHGKKIAIGEKVNIARQAGLTVQRLVFTGLASAFAVTRAAERNNRRCVVIDIGSSCTSWVSFYEVGIAASGVIEAGGDAITAEVVSSQNVSWAKAEQRKTAPPTDSAESAIVARHLIDLFCNVAERIRLGPSKIGYVYLTGGTSRFSNIELTAAGVFDRPVYRVTATDFAGQCEPIRPEQSTALGLLKYAFAHGDRPSPRHL
jgi:cell division ATPase FtsA